MPGRYRDQQSPDLPLADRLQVVGDRIDMPVRQERPRRLHQRPSQLDEIPEPPPSDFLFQRVQVQESLEIHLRAMASHRVAAPPMPVDAPGGELTGESP